MSHYEDDSSMIVVPWRSWRSGGNKKRNIPLEIMVNIGEINIGINSNPSNMGIATLWMSFLSLLGLLLGGRKKCITVVLLPRWKSLGWLDNWGGMESNPGATGTLVFTLRIETAGSSARSLRKRLFFYVFYLSSKHPVKQHLNRGAKWHSLRHSLRSFRLDLERLIETTSSGKTKLGWSNPSSPLADTPKISKSQVKF